MKPSRHPEPGHALGVAAGPGAGASLPSSDGLASRRRAHAVVHAVLDRGRTLDDALRSDRGLPELAPRDRAFARRLATAALRRLGQLDAVVGSFLDRPLPDGAWAARNALRLGACQILFLGTPPHAAVDTSAALARRGPRRFVPVVNAVLRRLAAAPAGRLAERFPPSLNVPRWLRDSWTAAYGAEAVRRIAEAHLRTPPLDVTVRDDPAGWAARLGGERLAGDTVRIAAPRGEVAALPGYGDGAWWVQDAAAALPARLLLSAAGAGGRACDMCAAPGGKTAQLAAAGLAVDAVDVSGSRLRLVRDNLRRLGLAARIVEADAAAWTPERLFDAVLLDAPCAGTGTIRRRPDIAWLRTPADPPRLAALQARLLRAALDLCRPGGTVVYSVCSLEPEEGAPVVDAALRERPAVRDPVRPGELGGLPAAVTAAGDVRTLPCDLGARGGMDGFFVARLRRTAERRAMPREELGAAGAAAGGGARNRPESGERRPGGGRS